MVQELEQKLKDYLGVKNILFVSNGTIAIQLAIKALELKGEIITTPFSYVATTTSVIWENCQPVFADIDPITFCISPEDIEKRITPNTSAILATHVYGNACDVEKIQAIANKHNLNVIYDGAHSFGVKIGNESIFNFGDISTISFHATKLFHTIEGGAIVVNDDELAKKLFLYRSFGHIGDGYYTIGINGKNSEFHAAMGLTNLPHVAEIMENRKTSIELYRSFLHTEKISHPEKLENQTENYSYFPVVFENEETLLRVRKNLLDNEISTRRYFYPSLNNLPYLTTQYSCPISENISCRVLCLPLYYGLEKDSVERICNIVNASL